MQLEIEREALRNEKDVASVDRLERLDRELADRKETRTRLHAQWQHEKASIQATRGLTEQLEQLEQVRLAIERAQLDGDYAKASELQYGRLPELKRQVVAQTQGDETAADARMLKEQVDEDDIAEVSCALGFSWTLDCERVLAGGVSR